MAEKMKLWIAPLKNLRQSKKLLLTLIDILAASGSQLVKLKMKTVNCFMRF